MASESRGAGGAFFAGVIMIVAGVLAGFEGLAAIVKGTFFVSAGNYWITTSASSWGWVHLLLALIVVLVGFAILAGQTWARVIGIIVASLSALANFAFIPYYPFWAIMLVAIDLWVIWALCVWEPQEIS